MALFGTNDKLALELFIVAVALLIGAGLGLVARRRYVIAAAAFVAFGVIGFVAAQDDPLANASMVAVAAAISVGVGLWVLGWLLDRSRDAVAVDGDRRDQRAEMPDWSRRSFLIRAGARRRRGGRRRGRSAGTCSRADAPRRSATDRPIPPASVTVPPLTPEADLSTTIGGLTPIVMPNDQLLPDRHRAPHAERVHRPAGRCASTAWSTARRS